MHDGGQKTGKELERVVKCTWPKFLYLSNYNSTYKYNCKETYNLFIILICLLIILLIRLWGFPLHPAFSAALQVELYVLELLPPFTYRSSFTCYDRHSRPNEWRSFKFDIIQNLTAPAAVQKNPLDQLVQGTIHLVQLTQQCKPSGIPSWES